MKRNSLSVARRRSSGGSPKYASSSAVSVVVEVVVDGEVAEIEVAVALRVLPVDDLHPLSVVQEVGGEQVVVAGHRLVLRVARDRRLDALGVGPCRIEATGWLRPVLARKLGAVDERNESKPVERLMPES